MNRQMVFRSLGVKAPVTMKAMTLNVLTISLFCQKWIHNQRVKFSDRQTGKGRINVQTRREQEREKLKEEEEGRKKKCLYFIGILVSLTKTQFHGHLD